MITDKSLVKEFYEQLDRLEKDEVYMILGGARKKYAKDNPDISTSHEIITRQLVKENDFDLFYQAVRKTDALLNVSTDKNTKKDFPKESHVIYCAINPRSTIQAKWLCDTTMNKYYHTLLLNASEQGRKDAYGQIKRFKVHYYSALQKAASDNKWRILDIDVIYLDIVYDAIVLIKRKNIKFVTRTHRGYHIIYDRRANEHLLGNRGLEFLIKTHRLNINQIETFKDRLTPIWGTEQGGFTVRPYYLLKENENETS